MYQSYHAETWSASSVIFFFVVQPRIKDKEWLIPIHYSAQKSYHFFLGRFLIAWIIRPAALISWIVTSLRYSIGLLLIICTVMWWVSYLILVFAFVIHLCFFTGITSWWKAKWTLVINITRIQKIIFNRYIICLWRSMNPSFIIITIPTKLSFGNIVVTVHVNNLHRVLVLVVSLGVDVHSGGVAEFIITV